MSSRTRGGHPERRVRLSGVDAALGEDALEFDGTAVGGVVAGDVGGGDRPVALDGAVVAEKQAGGQQLLERDGERDVADADERRRPAAGARAR